MLDSRLSFKKGGGEGECLGVSGNTDFDAAPTVPLTRLYSGILGHLCGLRQVEGKNTPVLIAKMNVAAAYR